MQASPLPHWVQIIQALGPTAVSVMVGFLAAYIAYRQWRTGQDKLRLDLFEKRYEYFVTLRKFMIFVIQHGQPDQATINDFYRKMVGAEFVFDKELAQYIESVRQRSQRLLDNDRLLGITPVGDHRSKLVNEDSELFMEINNEFADLETKFGKSMSLGKL